MGKYYNLLKGETSADLYIYGDITSMPWLESDVDSYSIVNELNELEADNINVYLNSYGGEVAEGLAIYNALKRHPAKVTTICDGFACSIASVIFMAGDERVMSNASLLMIHNPWTCTAGNAEELRKEADDLEKIAEASYAAYLDHINISRDELKALLDAETWLTPAEAIDMGFATMVKAEEYTHAHQSVKKAMIEKLLHKEEEKPPVVEQEEPPIEEPKKEPPTMMELLSGFFNAKN